MNLFPSIGQQNVGADHEWGTRGSDGQEAMAATPGRRGSGSHAGGIGAGRLRRRWFIGREVVRQGAEPSRAASGRPSRPAFDPPVRFDGPTVELTDAQQPSTTSGEALRPALTLADGVAYITAEGGLEAIDTGTGDARWNVDTEHPADPGGFGSKRVAPWVSADGRTAYAAFGREVEGKGRRPTGP